MLKKFSDELCLPMVLIIQKSLNQKQMPSKWKHANVIPVYKGKGNRHKVNNYRPISLTSTICKVMETYLYDILTKHCSECNIFKSAQHGFRENHSLLPIY